MRQQGLNVLRAEVSTARHQHRSNNQHCKRPPPGPVEYVVTFRGQTHTVRLKHWNIGALPHA